MKLKRCEFGHYYDPARYDQCPHCQARNQSMVNEYTLAKGEETEYAPDAGNEYAPEYAPAAYEAPDAAVPAEDEVTVAHYENKMGFSPIAGWLVCVSGAAKGNDYLIRTERNTLGRSDSMDITIKGDLGISRDTHAIISYNPRNRVFHLIAGEGKSIIYLNGHEVITPMELKPYDRIEISETMLIFIPLCGPQFAWED